MKTSETSSAKTYEYQYLLFENFFGEWEYWNQ